MVPIIDIDGRTALQVAKGGVFSFYEFHWPADDRLTDEKWRQMLDEGKSPSKPDWTGSFRVDEGAYSDLSSAVASFENDLTYIYWDPVYSLENLSRAQEGFRAEIENLGKAKQYIGHQLVNVNFRSFDLQSENNAVVTARETWMDKLYSFSGDTPSYEEQAVKERGPYPLDVTYILEKVEESWGSVWEVVQAQYNSQPPGW